MQTSYDKENVIYAGFFIRLAAFLIDNIVVAIGLLFIKVPVWILKIGAGDSAVFHPILFEYDIFAILYYLLTVGYFILATYFCGTTLGKFLLKIKVVDTEGQKLSFMTVLMRETVGRYLSQLIIFVGYFMIGLDGCKQGLHDKICDTYVVYTHKVPVRKPVERTVVPVPAVQNALQEEITANTVVQEE